MRFCYLLGGGATTGSSSASRISGVTSHGSTLYIPLTSYCNTRTLPQTRGPGFVLPPSVVAALCRVRDVESEIMQWEPWCQWLDTQDAPQRLPEKSTLIPSWLDIKIKQDTENDDRNHRPTVDELIQDVQPYIDHVPSIAIGGEGESTLRPKALLELIQRLRQHRPQQSTTTQQIDTSTTTTTKQQTNPCCIRLMTNGLISPTTCYTNHKKKKKKVVDDHDHDNDSSDDATTSHDAAYHLLKQAVAAGLDAVSVALMSHDCHQYESWMQPVIPSSSLGTITAHDCVVQFLNAAVQLSPMLQVEVTAVDHPDVDRLHTEALAQQLGVTQPIRWRSYFP